MEKELKCPDSDKLRQFAVGLTRSEFDEVDHHIARCSFCQERLEELAEDVDDFVSELQDVRPHHLEQARQQMLADSQFGESMITEIFGENTLPIKQEPTLAVPCMLGPYYVSNRISRGGMGEVYQARHEALDKVVAIKVLRSGREKNPLAKQRFLQERKLVGQLQHPNLVQAFDANSDGDNLYIAFEYVEGDTLEHLKFVMREDDVISTAHGILDGLDYIHRRGMIHCDLKPSNIMLTHGHEIKILDLGLAAIAKNEDSSLSRAGTPGYMAPEQAQSEMPIDFRADYYGFGSVIHHLLTGKPPKSTGVIVDLCPDRWQGLLKSLIAESPNDRPQSIAEIRESLKKVKVRTGAFLKWMIAGVLVLFLILGMVLLPGDSHQITVIKNSISMNLVKVPAGSFMMGAHPDDPQRQPNELPQRHVVFEKSFYIGQCEVTIGQYRRFCEATGYKTAIERGDAIGWKASFNSSFGEQSPDFRWESPGHVVTDEHPVTLLTYDDAVAFCAWLSQLEERIYRLPTEAEWEYVAKAGKNQYPWYGETKLNDFAWYARNGGKKSWPVGRRSPNPWGVYDIIGNVRERCQDVYLEDAYEQPYDRSKPILTGGLNYSQRGGCFIDSLLFLRPSFRGWDSVNNPINNCGFRVLLEE